MSDDEGKSDIETKPEKVDSKSRMLAKYHGLIYAQERFLNRIKKKFEQISSMSETELTQIWVQTTIDKFIADMEAANRNEKNILSSGKLINDSIIKKYLDEDLFSTISDEYCELISILKSKSVKNVTQPIQSSNDDNKHDLKLPRLDLPTFSGKYEEWLPFYNLFISSVHNKTNLDPVQKLHYLLNSVTGDAYDQIKNLALNDTNYQVAMDLLSENYYHKRQVAETYMKSLLDSKPMQSENPKDLKHFINNIKECLECLKQLDLPVDSWGYILLYNLEKKIAPLTKEKWNEKIGVMTDIPSFEDFMNLIKERYRISERSTISDKDVKKQQKVLHTKNILKPKVTQKNKFANSNNNNSYNNQRNNQSKSFIKRIKKCNLCKGDHIVTKCKRFLSNSPQNRRNLATQYQMCFNCLGSNHTNDICYSTRTCIYCQQRHHSLLHVHNNNENFTENNSTITDSQINSQSNPQPGTSNAFYTSVSNSQIRVLGTAVVRLENTSGFSTTARVLLDPCAEENYITDSTVHSIGLEKYLSPASVTGLNNVTVSSVDYKVNFKIKSIDGNFEFNSCASVVDNITTKLPSQFIEPENFGVLNNLPLADSNFNQPGKINLLLGIEFWVKIKQAGLRKFKDFIAEQTLLGWVISGHVSSEINSGSRVFLTQSKSVKDENLSLQLQKFFEIEEFTDNIPKKPEDLLCEQKFINTIERCDDGKLMVELPFREDSDPIIGPSKHIAMRRFLNIEKRLEKDPKLKEEYAKTFTDYLENKHLLLVTEPSIPGHEFFLPHHAVTKDSSTTTKLRVVFDGSCKSADCTSLNDHLLTGPKLQIDIRDVFFNWRSFKYSLTADIAKMYRMFWIAKHHRNYQKVLWRFHKDEEIREYALATVTFGTSAAPFQAIRSLHFIAEKEKSNFPLASKALLSDFYVDDFISGSHSLDEAIEIQTQLRTVLSSYGLNIRKWSSNFTEALHEILTEDLETLTELKFEDEEFRKTLGVYWAPKGDFFSFSIDNYMFENLKFTKRMVLSLIARLYDPLGWVSPCTLYAKIIMQKIWEQKIEWDDEICGSIKIEFEKFLKDLPNLTNLKIPRWVNITDNHSSVTLYGFSDASFNGYGAVLYLLDPSVTKHKLILLASKTRVKPLKHLSLARLELCAAVMLSELIKWAKKLLNPREVNVFAFSDSKITLSWIKSHPSRWKIYVAGRTSKILEHMTAEQWSYVNTKHNPADYASRGLLPSEIVTNSLWWNGPSLEILKEDDNIAELTENDHNILLTESKESKTVLHTLISSGNFNELLNNISSHGKMCRIMRNILNFIIKLLLKIITKNSEKKDIYILIVSKFQKFNYEEDMIIRLVQRLSFAKEIQALENKENLPKNSKLLSQSPFLDGFGILRVGGRLENSLRSYNQKHPVILPTHHQVSTNLIHLAHHSTLHGGNKSTLAYLRQKFHIVRGSDRVRSIIKQCVTCLRFAKYSHSQLMGSLPKDRVNPHRPFLNTGVDYAGPFTLKPVKGRCKIRIKYYIALFICMVTKAIHIEIVSSLTAESFIESFLRFSNRRGYVQNLYSDQGTNFVKANKIFNDEILKAQISWKSDFEQKFRGTKWHFNPPGSPHFGGLWEAGVKSIKTHLYKTVGNAILTPEEFSTLLIQIEGILNSRPLCPLNENPNETDFLSPSHFLIGESIVAPPQRAYNLESSKIVDRFHYIQKLQQNFWKFWKNEYLHRLNNRPKWKQPGNNFKTNDLVILTDENTAPSYWPLARIIDTHPGSDGITRVVTIKTSKGQTFKRPISKLRLLPYESNFTN